MNTLQHKRHCLCVGKPQLRIMYLLLQQCLVIEIHGIFPPNHLVKLPARNTKSVVISLFLKFDLARSTTKQTAIRIAVNFICVINEKNLMHFRVSTWGAATFRFKNKEAENKGAFGMITDILI